MVGVSEPTSFKVAPFWIVKVEPQVKAWALMSKMPNTVVQVWVATAKVVESIAGLVLDLFTLNIDPKVPAVLDTVEVAEPSKDSVRFAPPKVPEELNAASPWTMRV